MAQGVAWFAVAQFPLLLGAIALFLWNVHRLPSVQAGVALAALTACLWALGAVMQGRITMRRMLVIEVAAIGVAAAAFL